MSSADEIWLPLVDEPIGEIVAGVLEEHPDVRPLVDTPRRVLAFRTFAYIRVGMLLGELLVDAELAPYDGTGTWVEQLLQDPRHRRRIAEEVRRVAEEIAADPHYAEEDEPLGPDEAARERFRAFARQQLDSA